MFDGPSARDLELARAWIEWMRSNWSGVQSVDAESLTVVFTLRSRTESASVSIRFDPAGLHGARRHLKRLGRDLGFRTDADWAGLGMAAEDAAHAAFESRSGILTVAEAAGDYEFEPPELGPGMGFAWSVERPT